MPLPVTPKQKEVLDFIVQFINEQGFPPSYREIADGLKLASPSTVHVHIQALRERGYLRANGGSARELEPTDKAVRWGRSAVLPLKGLITAGQPIEAVEENETFAVPVDLAPDSANSYVLRVKGESMIEDGILDGDYVVVERNPSPKNGDVVVALLDNSYATLKRFYREKDRIRLQPANSKMKPIYCHDPLIQGVVRAVIRSFRARAIGY
jgi:repressor LexA